MINMKTISNSEVHIRSLTLDDLPAIKKIEKKIMFSRDQKYIDETFPNYIENGPKEANLGAEIDGKLVGFLLGRTEFWETGWIDSSKTGWIIAVGVMPEHQGSGIGKLLGLRILEFFKKNNVKKLKAIVGWDQADLIAYFKSLEFNICSEILVQREI